MPERAFVSIVIATRNRERLLQQTLTALANQTWPRDRCQLLIADNGSTDSTASIVRSTSAAANALSTRYLHVAEPGKSRALNAAFDLLVAEASHHGENHIIALTDDDVEPEPQWLEALCGAFADSRIDFVAGHIQPRWEVEPPPWMSPALYGVLAVPDSGDERVPITSAAAKVMPIGANMAVRARVIASLGGLRTDFGKLEGTLRTGEDHEFFLRMLGAGYRGVYEPSAVVRHFVPRERLDRAYCRRWLFQNGQDVARLDESYSAPVARLFGVPRYLWRQTGSHVISLIRASLSGDAAARFAAAVRVWWFGGYLRHAWFRR
jgi:glucosyl-dolichyl phosphate glucuronosyltransferase